MLSADFFSNELFFKINILLVLIWVTGPNCLQRLSADDSSRQRVLAFSWPMDSPIQLKNCPERDMGFPYLSTKTYVVGTHWKCFSETLQVSTTNAFLKE